MLKHSGNCGKNNLSSKFLLTCCLGIMPAKDIRECIRARRSSGRFTAHWFRLDGSIRMLNNELRGRGLKSE